MSTMKYVLEQYLYGLRFNRKQNLENIKRRQEYVDQEQALIESAKKDLEKIDREEKELYEAAEHLEIVIELREE